MSYFFGCVCFIDTFFALLPINISRQQSNIAEHVLLICHACNFALFWRALMIPIDVIQNQIQPLYHGLFWWSALTRPF